MHEQALRELGRCQVATMLSVVAVAGNLVERLVSKGVLSVEDGLVEIAEELRTDGDKHRDYGEPAYRIASDIEQRAFALGK